MAVWFPKCLLWLSLAGVCTEEGQVLPIKWEDSALCVDVDRNLEPEVGGHGGRNSVPLSASLHPTCLQ